MNALTKAETVDQQTGEITTKGLPVGYQSGNQSLAVSIAMAEVDQQITTAHAYPRSVDLAVKNILTLATLDEESAKECVYALPRGNKPIKGPSIRLAEIIQACWGNNRTGTRVVHVDRIEKYIEAEGVFHDLETNAATTSRVRRRIVDSRGRLYNDDMIIVTGNAAASIAKRNAILAGVPKAVWRKAYGEVERVIVGDVTTMAEKREDAMKAFAAFGVTPERIFAVLEIGGLADINLEHYTTLIGMHQALRSGEATVEEMFPIAKPKAEQPTDLKGKLDKLAEGKDQPSTAGDEPAETKSDAGRSPAGTEAGKQSSPAAAEQAPSSGQTPRTPLDDGASLIATADRRGRSAYRKGMRRDRCLPVDYKAEERGAERDAFFAGFDDEADRDAPEPGSVEEGE